MFRRTLLSTFARRSLFSPRAINNGSAALFNISKRNFSSSIVAFDVAETKELLFAKLSSELELESESPVKISEDDLKFLEQEGYNLDHKSGEKIVTLSKPLEDGLVLKVYFDCTELNDIHASGAQELAARELEEAENEDFEAESSLENSLLNVNIIIENTKTNESLVAHSYLSYDDLEFFPQSFQVIKDNELANSLTAESQQLKLSKYNGPGFQMLDEELQELFEAYFADLGCDEQLGEFIVNYSTVAENDEYIHWLKDLKKFFN